MSDAAFEVVSAIDKIFPDLHLHVPYPGVVVDANLCPEGKSCGHYDWERNQISISSYADDLTLAHEYGHWVYHKIYVREVQKTGVAGGARSEKASVADWERLFNAGSIPAGKVLQFYSCFQEMPSFLVVPIDRGGEINLARSAVYSLKEAWANAFAQLLALHGNAVEANLDMEHLMQQVDERFPGDKIAPLSETDGYLPKDQLAKSSLLFILGEAVDTAYSCGFNARESR